MCYEKNKENMDIQWNVIKPILFIVVINFKRAVLLIGLPILSRTYKIKALFSNNVLLSYASFIN